MEDAAGVPKTYYLRIRWRGRTFYKIGLTQNRLKDRFRKEPATCQIEIVQLWHHKTLAQAGRHEAQLFKLHKGALPFIGRTGPLIGGGNTEVFCHDVIGGEPPPVSVEIIRFDSGGWRDTGTFYADFDPYKGITHRPFWVAHYYGPPTLSFLMPLESNVRRLVVVDGEYLIGEKWDSMVKKRSMIATMRANYIVSDYQSALNDVRKAGFN